MAWQYPDTRHFLLDHGPTRTGFDPFKRPVATSTAKLVERTSLGNLHFELPVNAGCGYADARHLVVCLDADYRLTPIESLRVLAFAVDPVVLKASSSRAQAAVADLIHSHAPEAQMELVDDQRCTGACEYRVTLESQ